jgi:hypothetical protein
MPTTTNNGWPTPADTDLVKNGADAIRDLGNAIDTTLGVYTPVNLGAWTSYTPTLKQSSTTVTATVDYAKYKQLGKTVFLRVKLTVTGSGSAGGIIGISAPASLVPTTDSLESIYGTFGFLDAGVAYYHGYCAYSSTNNGFVGIAQGGGNAMGANSPSTTASVNDVYMCSVTYEVV